MMQYITGSRAVATTNTGQYAKTAGEGSVVLQRFSLYQAIGHLVLLLLSVVMFWFYRIFSYACSASTTPAAGVVVVASICSLCFLYIVGTLCCLLMGCFLLLMLVYWS
ncbi:hypothetical protein NC651_033653 [Populus alba x Populus x berolinensis]|nr:hypothetical protein NC651_033653 [Populus alba x Populus x berolinensis]